MDVKQYLEQGANSLWEKDFITRHIEAAVYSNMLPASDRYCRFTGGYLLLVVHKVDTAKTYTDYQQEIKSGLYRSIGLLPHSVRNRVLLHSMKDYQFDRLVSIMTTKERELWDSKVNSIAEGEYWRIEHIVTDKKPYLVRVFDADSDNDVRYITSFAFEARALELCDLLLEEVIDYDLCDMGLIKAVYNLESHKSPLHIGEF